MTVDTSVLVVVTGFVVVVTTVFDVLAVEVTVSPAKWLVTVTTTFVVLRSVDVDVDVTVVVDAPDLFVDVIVSTAVEGHAIMNKENGIY